ncbi:MAG TPA: thiol-activated cytolysin family protein [Candidatus Krumholzibacteria bacterium]|nr:thiol-activated cytolysin family protein [Candidatus Krumholzibacteria bacterium]HPD70204.1 thiol-activated cytolysin family protein [Candidatus Krumholzibacteria bacterium]HRY40096.1 thiol-activated cytolysin family protein [Candidatus Krumholzibacteria bacterium]
MANRIPILTAVLALVAIAASLVGCGSDDSPTAVPPADVATYLAALPSWIEFSPPAADAEGPVGDPEIEYDEVDGVPYTCESTPHSLTRTPDRIVTLNPDVEILWPGVLLQGSGHLNGIGSLAELPIRQRAPLTLSIDLLTGENTRVVDQPDLASVSQAIGDLIQAAADAGHTAGSSINYLETSMHSVNQVALKLGLSASYMSASIKANLEASVSADESSLTANFTQRMFTVSMVLPQTPAEVFNDDFTEERLAEQIDLGRLGPDNLPVYISSVVYGRILMFSITASTTEDSLRASLEALYNAGELGGVAEAAYTRILSQSELSVVTVGGDAAAAEALIRSGDLSDYFVASAPLTTARPISYTVRNLADNTIATVSETTEYNLRACATEPTGAEYQLHLQEMTATEVGCDVFNPSNLTDHLTVDAYYRIRVQDFFTGNQDLGYWAWNAICPVGLTLWEDDSQAVVNNGDTNCQLFPTEAKTFRIHFDGRDHVLLYGEVWDWDAASADDRVFHTSLRFEYPDSPLPTNPNYVITGARENDTVIRLSLRLEKVRDLYD